RDAGRQAHHCQELPRIVLMQNVVRELRSDPCLRCDRDEQLSRIHGQGAIEILWCDSHNCRDLAIQAKNLPHGVGRRIEAIAPETIADHHDGRVAGLVKFGTEHSPTLWLDAEHGKIVGRYKLPEYTLGFPAHIALEPDIERDASLECSDSR